MKPIGQIEFYDATLETLVAISIDEVKLLPGEEPQVCLSGGLWTAAVLALNADTIAGLRRLLDQAEADLKCLSSCCKARQGGEHQTSSGESR